MQLVGYQVSRASRGTRGRDLNVPGWSTEGLERRLTAMREVLGRLAAGPGVTAVALELGASPPPCCQAGRSATAHRPGQSPAARMYLAHLRHPRAPRPARPSRRPSLRVAARRRLARRRRDRRHRPAASAGRQTCRRVLPGPARAHGPRSRPGLRDPPGQPRRPARRTPRLGRTLRSPSRPPVNRRAQPRPSLRHDRPRPDSLPGTSQVPVPPSPGIPGHQPTGAPTPRQASAQPSARPGGRTFPSGRPRRR